jgi:penicillin-binding protein 2
MRPRKSVNVAALVASPEDQPSRPSLRLNVIGLIVVALFAALVLRLWTLQVIDAKNYTAAVNANAIRVVPVVAPRGLIVDRGEHVLVGNTVEQEIVLSRAEAQADPQVIGEVAALTGETPDEVDHALTNEQYSPYQPVPVLLNAPMATVQFLEEHQSSYPGVSVEQVTQRSYPQGGMTAAQLLGYVGDINSQELAEHPNQGYIQSSQIGKSGLEAEYEQALRGVAGEQALEVDRTGTVVGTLRKTNPVQGDTVVTNIDLGLQQTLEQALANQIKIDRKTPDPRDNNQLPPAINGAAIALDPQNGQVLAMASFPTYNLNEWIGGISESNYAAISASGAENNYVIQGLYTPGSTFKLITATAALQKGIISPSTYVDDTGTFKIQNCTGGSCTFHNDDSEALGEVDLPEALTASDDFYFYNLGELFWEQRAKFGDTPIQDVGMRYGVETPTGVDLPGETSLERIDSPAVRKALHTEDPKAFPYDTWYTGDNVEMAFGQGGTVLTPIGLADAYATFANGGTHYIPEIASSVVSPSGKVVDAFPPRVSRINGQPDTVTLPPSIYDPILQGLEGVISNPKGTAYADFQGFPLSTFPLAGKTGTASNAPGQEPNSWFVAFGPLPNPQYLVLVVIGQGGYGASAAAPVVRTAFNYLETNPVSPVVLPSSAHPPSNAPATINPPFGTPTTTTTTTTTTSTTTPPSDSTTTTLHKTTSTG